MTTECFNKVLRTLRANWAYAKFVDDEISQSVLFNSLGRFDDETITNALATLIQTWSDVGDGRYLQMTDVIRAVERESEIKREAQKDKDMERLVRCPKCKDLGYTVIIYPETRAAEGMTPCDCPIGREKFPWFFLTEDEERMIREDQKKRGQNPPKAHRAPDAYRMWYCYGIGDGT